jgi:uncharacterized membrane protein
MADVGFARALKRYFLAGLFILTPVLLTLLSVGWLVKTLDEMAGFVLLKVFGFHIPGLGLVLTVALIIVVGMLLSTNALVQSVFGIFEEGLLRMPGVRAVYKTLKSLTDAFSPVRQQEFQNVVLVEYPHAGVLSVGFVTRRFTLQRAAGGEEVVAVYVPTNHVYLGNTIVVPASKVVPTTLNVENGLQAVLSSGASLPETIEEAPR